jgi:hypothetical protein
MVVAHIRKSSSLVWCGCGNSCVYLVKNGISYDSEMTLYEPFSSLISTIIFNHYSSTICLNMLVCTLLIVIVSFEKAGRRNTVTEMRIYLLMLLLPLMIQNIVVLTKRSNKPASTKKNIHSLNIWCS